MGRHVRQQRDGCAIGADWFARSCVDQWDSPVLSPPLTPLVSSWTKFMGLFDVFKVDVRVRLDRHVFYPGNAITGVAEVNVSSPISFVAIRVKLTAKERVSITKDEITHYQDQHGVRQQRRTPRTYSTTTAILKQLLTLCGQMKNGGSRMSQTLPPGRYVFPFQFVLPLEALLGTLVEIVPRSPTVSKRTSTSPTAGMLRSARTSR